MEGLNELKELVQKELNIKEKEEESPKKVTLKELMEQKEAAQVAAFFGLNQPDSDSFVNNYSNNNSDGGSIFENLTAPNYVDNYDSNVNNFSQVPNYVEDQHQVIDINNSSSIILGNNVPDFASNNQNVIISSPAMQSVKKENKIEYIPSVSETRNLKDNSVLHQCALETKRNLEGETQKIHSTLWNFIAQTKTIESFCGCMNPVSYPYNFRTAVFNEAQYSFLRKKFYDLHQYNISPVFMSLYRQTFSELQLCYFVHFTISHVIPSLVRFLLIFFIIYILFYFVIVTIFVFTDFFLLN